MSIVYSIICYFIVFRAAMDEKLTELRRALDNEMAAKDAILTEARGKSSASVIKLTAVKLQDASINTSVVLSSSNKKVIKTVLRPTSRFSSCDS